VEEVVQVWSLALHEAKGSTPAAVPQQHSRLGAPTGCGLSFLDLVDTSDGESLR